MGQGGISKVTVNPQIRLEGLILFLWVQMRVLLEFGSFSLLLFEFALGVLFEGESYLKIYGI